MYSAELAIAGDAAGNGEGVCAEMLNECRAVAVANSCVGRKNKGKQSNRGCCSAMLDVGRIRRS